MQWENIKGENEFFEGCNFSETSKSLIFYSMGLEFRYGRDATVEIKISDL